MNINKYVKGNGVNVFRISGKLISSNIENLKNSLDSAIEEPNCKIILNCRNVNIIDSAAVGLLIGRARAAKKNGGYFCFCEPQPAIYRLFSMVDVGKWMDIFTTEEEALRVIESQSKVSES
ncbi:MAG: STAS domain-containing protein [Nitrospinota bacterium]|nr:STAS domain-containing protein [Nitrospinota bacterium]MDH5677790.1 STAS domain-containing protein [Nitrospinota bacterium]